MCINTVDSRAIGSRGANFCPYMFLFCGVFCVPETAFCTEPTPAQTQVIDTNAFGGCFFFPGVTVDTIDPVAKAVKFAQMPCPLECVDRERRMILVRRRFH